MDASKMFSDRDQQGPTSHWTVYAWRLARPVAQSPGPVLTQRAGADLAYKRGRFGHLSLDTAVLG
jgi:hypothetical protein